MSRQDWKDVKVFIAGKEIPVKGIDVPVTAFASTGMNFSGGMCNFQGTLDLDPLQIKKLSDICENAGARDLITVPYKFISHDDFEFNFNVSRLSHKQRERLLSLLIANYDKVPNEISMNDFIYTYLYKDRHPKTHEPLEAE